jgi:hypothetical protein
LRGFKFKKDHSEKEKPGNHGKVYEKERLFDLLIHDLTSPLSIVSTTADNLLQKSDRYGALTDQQKRGRSYFEKYPQGTEITKK